jgi:hypothetical protein
MIATSVTMFTYILQKRAAHSRPSRRSQQVPIAASYLLKSPRAHRRQEAEYVLGKIVLRTAA